MPQKKIREYPLVKNSVLTLGFWKKYDRHGKSNTQIVKLATRWKDLNRRKVKIYCIQTWLQNS